MMLANVLTKSVRDRWPGTTVGMALVGLLLLLAMAAYQQIDTSFYDDLPEAIRSVMGIPEGADAAALAYAVTFGLVASLTLAGLAISMGAAAVAGEEQDGTLGLLLGNPRSRRQVLLARAGAGACLLAVGATVAFAAAHAVPAVLGVEIGSSDVLAVTVHLLLNAMLWGAVALAVGSATGRRAAASGTAVGLMLLSYFLVGLLPLVERFASLAPALPWYWFDGHDPLNNGFSSGHGLLQVGAVGALLATAWWRVDHRDLVASAPGGALRKVVDRVRRDARAARLLDRLSGATRLRGLAAKTFSEGRVVVTVTALVMFSMMGLLMGPIYAAIGGSIAEMSAALPEALLAIAGGGDMSTPEGWYRLETFGLMAPIGTTLAATLVGVRALAGEERARTMGLLLANPVSRRRVMLAKAGAMVLHAGIVGTSLFAGVLGGSLLAGLDMSPANIAAASLQATLLGTLFGAFGLAVGAATGDVRKATVATIVAATAAYATNTFLLVASSLAGWAGISPFHWYLGGDPLVNGIDAPAVALFTGLTSGLVLVATALFDRRDLRLG